MDVPGGAVILNDLARLDVHTSEYYLLLAVLTEGAMACQSSQYRCVEYYCPPVDEALCSLSFLNE